MKKGLLATLSVLCLGCATVGVACSDKNTDTTNTESQTVVINGFNHWDDVTVIYLDPATFDGSMKLNKEKEYIVEGDASYKCYINSTKANQPELRMAASGRKTNITDVSEFGLYIYNTSDYAFDVIVTAYAADKAVCAPYATVQPGENNLVFDINRAVVQTDGKVITEYSIAFSGVRADTTFYIDNFYVNTTTDPLTLTPATQAVVDGINGLPNDASREQVESVMASYNALSADEKQSVTNYSRLQSLINPYWIQDLDAARKADDSKLLYFGEPFAAVQITGSTSGVGSYGFTDKMAYGDEAGSLRVDFTVSPTNWVNLNTSAKTLIDEEYIEFYVYNDSDQYKAMCVGWNVPINSNYETYMVLEPHAWTQVWARSTDLTNSGGSSGAFEICGLSDLTDRRASSPKGTLYFSSITKIRPSAAAQAVIDEIETLTNYTSRKQLESVMEKYQALATIDKQAVNNYDVLQGYMSAYWNSDLSAAQTNDPKTLLFFDEQYGVGQVEKADKGIAAYGYTTEKAYGNEAGSLKVEFYEKMPGFMPVDSWMSLHTTAKEDIDTDCIEFYVYNDSDQYKAMCIGWKVPANSEEEAYIILEPNAWTHVWTNSTDLTTGLPEGDPAVYNYRGRIQIVALSDLTNRSAVAPEGTLYISSVSKVLPSVQAQAVIEEIQQLNDQTPRQQLEAAMANYQALKAIDKQSVSNYYQLHQLLSKYWGEDINSADAGTLLHFNEQYGVSQITKADKGIAGYGYTTEKAYGSESGSLKVEFYEKTTGFIPVAGWMSLYTTATEDIAEDTIKFYVYNDSNQYKGIALGWIAPDGSPFGYQILEPNAWTEVSCKSSDLTSGLAQGDPAEYNYRGRIQIVAINDLVNRSVRAPEGALYFSSVQKMNTEKKVQEERKGTDANTLMFFDRKLGLDQVKAEGGFIDFDSTANYNGETGAIKMTYTGQSSPTLSWNTCGYQGNSDDYVVLYVKANIDAQYMTVRVGTLYGTHCINGKWTQVIFPLSALNSTSYLRFEASNDGENYWNAKEGADMKGTVLITKAKVISASEVKNLSQAASTDTYKIGQTEFVGTADYLGTKGTYLYNNAVYASFYDMDVASIGDTVRFYARSLHPNSIGNGMNTDGDNETVHTVIGMELAEASDKNKMYIVASGLNADEMYVQCFTGRESGHFGTAIADNNNLTYEVLEDGYVRFCLDLSGYDASIKYFRLWTGVKLQMTDAEVIHIRDVYFGD